MKASFGGLDENTVIKAGEVRNTNIYEGDEASRIGFKGKLVVVDCRVDKQKIR